jgi:hypothetical protein
MVDRNTTIGLLAVLTTVIATVSVTPQARAIAITRVNVVDVVDGRVVPNSTVTIRGKTITKSTSNLQRPTPNRLRQGYGGPPEL